MKKLVALLIAAVMVISLAACGQSTSTESATEAAPATEAAAKEEAKEEVKEETAAAAAEDTSSAGETVTFYSAPYTSDGSDLDWYAETFAPFTEETGINVEVTIVDWADIALKEKTEWMAGGGPDILTGCGCDWTMAEDGLVCELSENFTEEELADFNYLDDTSWEGKNYYIPYTGVAEWRFLAVNLDIMEAAGVEIPDGDWSWDDIVAAAKKVQEYDSSIYPFMTPLGGNANNYLYNYEAFLIQSGGQFHDDSKWTLDSEAGVNAFQFTYDLGNTYGILSKDCLTLGDEEVFSLFTEGKAAMIFADVFLDMDSIDFKWDAYNVYNPETKLTGAFNCVDGIAINTNSEHKEAAAKVINYLTSVEVVQRMRDTGFYQNGEMRKSDNGYKVPYEQLEDVAANPVQFFSPLFPGSENLDTELPQLQQQVFLGEKTPEEAAAQVQKACQDSYDEF